MAWNVFKFCTALRALGSIMILFVIGIIGFTYYALVLVNYGPSLLLGGVDSFTALLVLALFHFLMFDTTMMKLRLTLDNLDWPCGHRLNLVMVLWSYFSVVVTDPGGVPPGWRPELDIEKGDGNEAAIAEASPLSVGDSSSHILVKNGFFLWVLRWKMHTKDGPSLCLGCKLCWSKELQVFSPILGMSNSISANEFVVCGGPYSTISLFPAFLVFFTDGDDEITVSLGSLAATFIAFILNIAFALSVLGFLIMHIMLVARNTTTIEAYEKYTTPNSPYDLGRKANFEQVFGRDKMYWFVPLYTEEDMKRLPALGGLDFRSRLEESEPLQSL
ncbi:hypothetical protein YC2023_031774 [Brassica napus]